jgi:transcriptional regulator with XRE-family HTH domain
MKAKGHDQAAVARALGVSAGTPSRWLYCDRKPSLKLATLVEDKYGVPSGAWGRAPSKPFKLSRLAA